MNKKVMFFIVCLVVTIFVSTGSLSAEEMINKINVKATLPDSTTFTATVYENGHLVITKFNSTYRFAPVVLNAKENIAYMELVEETIDKSEENTHSFSSDMIMFEIIDVISISKKRLKEMGQCTTCCKTCNGTTVCACAVWFPSCQIGCCCDPCC